MTYDDWLQTIPPEITDDALWQMNLYRQALFLGELGWYDATKLLSDRRTIRLSDQLYRAAGKISSNIAEEPDTYELHPLNHLLQNVPMPPNTEYEIRNTE
jgi:hypothetical protein